MDEESDEFTGLATLPPIRVDNRFRAPTHLDYIGGKIVWHCAGQHGWIMSLTEQEAHDAVDYLRRLFGITPNHGIWCRKMEGLWYMEFRARGNYTGARPWHGCGATWLWLDWKQQDEADEEAKRRFPTGAVVTFFAKGRLYKGVVAGGRKRATVVIPGYNGKWHVPYRMLEQG